jgi:endonuclease YncB( thermonuclease family)
MKATRLLAIAFVCVGGVGLTAEDAQALPATKIFLNGVPTPVYFNDGDSFRVLAGRFNNSRARLKGFNTLESYGPVHQWGGWTRQELANYATLGTLNAQRGVWHCTSELKKDYYGRILWDCPDLAVDQVRKGLAHTMTFGKKDTPSRLEVAQNEAMKARRGIWAHGVPDYVMTSIHSMTEAWVGGKPYNRLVSSVTGRSKKWRHTLKIAECQTVCEPANDPDAVKIARFAAWTLGQAGFSGIVKGNDKAVLEQKIADFVKRGFLGTLADEGKRYRFELVLTHALASGNLTATEAVRSCMLYVTFKRRYGGGRAECLR